MRSRQEPNRRAEWKAPKAAYAHEQDVIGAGVSSQSNQFVIELERIIENEDQIGFYKNPKGTVGMEGTKEKGRAVHHGRR